MIINHIDDDNKSYKKNIGLVFGAAVIYLSRESCASLVTTAGRVQCVLVSGLQPVFLNLPGACLESDLLKPEHDFTSLTDIKAM